jgi:HK97 family phage portal protein
LQTRFTFWETVEESMAWRNNAYIWNNVDPVSGRVVEWWALHPDQVTPQYDGSGGIVYRVEVAPGYVDPVGKGKGIYHKGPETILHIRGHGEGGQLTAPTPIEVFKQALEGPIGRQRHEARMWRRGTALQVAIEFPAGVGKEQADQWREVWRANYEGTDGETTAVIGGGGTIKPIGMTAADAQFAELADLTVQDASRIMAVPANLLGVQVVKVRTNLEEDLMAWLRFGLAPELGRIEDALYAYPPLFGGSQTTPGFDTSEFVRGDLQTETAILVALVQSGIITPNEGRHKLGYERDGDPNSDTLQVTPVGGTENPGLGVKSLKPATTPTESADTEE